MEQGETRNQVPKQVSQKTMDFMMGSSDWVRNWHANQSMKRRISVDAIPLFHLAAGHVEDIGQQTRSLDSSEIHGFLPRSLKYCWYMADSWSNFFSIDPKPSKHGKEGLASTKLTMALEQKLFRTPRCTLWKKSL